MRCAASLVLVIVLAIGPALGGTACGDRTSERPTSSAAPAPALEAETKAASIPSTEPPAKAADEVTFVLDGEDRRLAILDPGHATINRLSAPPSVAIIARANEPSAEMLIIKLGGVDLDRATLPLQLRALGPGGPSVSVTNGDAAGTRGSGQIDAGTANDHLTIDAWDPAQRRLRGRFALRVKASGSTRALTRGSLDVVLHDPFDR